MADYTEGQRLKGSDGNVYVVQNGVPVLEEQSGLMGGVVTKAGDPKRPYEGPKAAADAGKAQVDATVAARTLDASVTKAQADADKARAEAQIAQTTAAQGNTGKGVSPEVRQAAIGGYRSAQSLRNQIAEIENTYTSGPGKTKGIAGLRDYLPTENNAVFNDASNAARAFGGPVLGFTASQLNTEKEQQRAIGPYIPNASDFDPQIEAKIKRLKGLADSAEKRSVQILGGIPNASGQIVPLGQGGGASGGGAVPPSGGSATPPAPSTGPAASPPRMVLAGSGDTRTEYDAAQSAALEQAIKSGAPISEITAKFPTADAGQITVARNYLKTHPDYSGFATVTQEKPNSLYNRISSSPLAVDAISAADAVLPMGVFGQDIRDKVSQAKAASPDGGLPGTLIGGTLGAAGLEAGLGSLAGRAGMAASPWIARLADAAYGGVQGAGNADDGSGALGAAEGAGAGILGGIAGRGLMRGVGNAVQGVTRAPVSYLSERGVPLTAGQTLGGTAKSLEDAATSIPLIGGVINNRRREGVQAFNREAFQQGVGTNTIGEQGVEDALTATRGQYRQALDGRNFDLTDPQFQAGLATERQAGAAIPRTGPEFDYEMQQRLDPFVQQGHINGPQMQDVLQGLRDADFGSDAMGSAASTAAGNTRGLLTGLIDAQAPDVMPALTQADRMYRNTNILADAVGRGMNTDGNFTAAQLGQAARSNAKRFNGPIAAATTDRPFYELQQAGQDVLPSQLNDSGTATRSAALATLGLAGIGLGGAGAGYGVGGDGEGAAAGGAAGVGGTLALASLAGLGGSRGGQRAIVSLLADRPDILRRLGAGIYNRSGTLGALGIPALSQAQQTITNNPAP